ncbi:hypothetical protein [Actinophytocola sp.]|uniref:hypothetical protein n=1 Tax=Actinophytocola sp. TaxID=1872138 RepID=UPI003D6C0452
MELYSELGDLVGQAITYINLGWSYECQEDFARALHYNLLALAGPEPHRRRLLPQG